MFKRLIADKSFYKRLILLMLPIMVQNGITNFVNMLDNIMIGAVGTNEMTGVAVTNQLLFVFNLCIFGAVSGAGIFGAQFFGSNDHEGVRNSFRFKLLFGTGLAIAGILIFSFAGKMMIGAYMTGEAGVTDPAVALSSAHGYLKIMLIGLIPFTIVQCYSSTLREGGQPSLPMIVGVCAVLVNLTLNYIFIFGKFGAPALGVKGAAISTVISRFVECIIIIIATHKDKIRYPYMTDVYRTLKVPTRLAGKLFIKGLPLMLNETLWSAGIAVINQSYSLCGLDAMAAVNISQTFWNVFSIAYLAVGNAVGIILGQMLGANKLKEAKKSSYQMIAFSFAIALIFGIIYFLCSELIPYAYKTVPEIRSLATSLIRITAVLMPFESLCHASYFTMRSGGKMTVTFIFDSVYTWCVNVVIAYVLTRFTSASFITVFTAIQLLVIPKDIAGILLVKSGFWAKNIVDDNSELDI